MTPPAALTWAGVEPGGRFLPGNAPARPDWPHERHIPALCRFTTARVVSLSGQATQLGTSSDAPADSPDSTPQTFPSTAQNLRKRACAASRARSAISQRAVAPAHVTRAGQCLASALCSWLLGDLGRRWGSAAFTPGSARIRCHASACAGFNPLRFSLWWRPPTLCASQA